MKNCWCSQGPQGHFCISPFKWARGLLQECPNLPSQGSFLWLTPFRCLSPLRCPAGRPCFLPLLHCALCPSVSP